MTKFATESALSPELLAKYEVVIGLEVHAQLLTKTKIFCGCSTRFGDAPNSNVCPVCLGLAGHSAGAQQARRRNGHACCSGAELHRPRTFSLSLAKTISIPTFRRATKSLNTNSRWPPAAGSKSSTTAGPSASVSRGCTSKKTPENPCTMAFPHSGEKTYVDFNRCGTPLSEIVSEPDMRAPDEAYNYLTTLRQILLYTGVSDCNMEEGSLRCDANVSVRLRGAKEFGTKVEVKNLNSFRYLAKALEFEIERHVGVVESGGRISQETRLWNQSEGRTEPMRSKEKAHDYRYFPEPDLLPVHITHAWREEIHHSLPELPSAKRARFVSAFGITPYDAEVLTDTQDLALFRIDGESGRSGQSRRQLDANGTSSRPE